MNGFSRSLVNRSRLLVSTASSPMHDLEYKILYPGSAQSVKFIRLNVQQICTIERIAPSVSVAQFYATETHGELTKLLVE
jgi:hypothetical protein